MIKQLVFSGLIVALAVLLLQRATVDVNEFVGGSFNMFWVVLIVLGTLWSAVRGFLTFRRREPVEVRGGFPEFDRQFFALMLSQVMIFGIANSLLFIVAVVQYYLNDIRLDFKEIMTLGLYFLEALLIFLLYFLIGSILGSYSATRRKS
ncbi:MAG: hypothetical protein GY940_07125 [bacterium]|nr:hypothetical protein [bacterium]